MADYGLTIQGSCLKRKPNSMAGIQRNSPEVVGWHCSIIRILTKTNIKNMLSCTQPTTIIGKVLLLHLLFSPLYHSLFSRFLYGSFWYGSSMWFSYLILYEGSYIGLICVPLSQDSFTGLKTKQICPVRSVYLRTSEGALWRVSFIVLLYSALF